MNRAGVWYGSSLSRTLQAFDCGHGYAQEEYAAKREKKRAFFDPSYTVHCVLKKFGYLQKQE